MFKLDIRIYTVTVVVRVENVALVVKFVNVEPATAVTLRVVTRVKLKNSSNLAFAKKRKPRKNASVKTANVLTVLVVKKEVNTNAIKIVNVMTSNK